MNKINSILWGFVFIVLGVIFGLNELDITHINLLFKGWWTLFIIVPCAIDFVTNKDKMGSLIGIAIGVILLATSRGIIEFENISKLILPALFIFIGISIIFKETISSKLNSKIKELNRKDLFNYSAIFSGQDVKYPNKEFIGANVSAVFGGADIDLTQSIITNESVLNTYAVFGGIDIFVPSGVNVVIKSTSIFGGCDNKVKNVTDENNTVPTLYINAFNLFGGIEIK